mgnify:CR=1 FL=1
MAENSYVPRLKEHYNSVVCSSLIEKFSYANPMQTPKLDKIVINIGAGEAVGDSKKIGSICEDLAAITGQKAVVTHAKKSIANFKLREGMPIGAKVTLRRDRMYEFLDRLINIAIPRIRDFRGMSPKQFDGRGNFAMGVTEQIIFPEIDYDQIDKLRGMDITISTTAASDEQGRALLAAFNFPFRS